MYPSVAAGRRLFMAAAFVVLSAVGGSVLSADKQTLEIVTSNGVHSFSVRSSTDDADRAKGLMFRRELPDRQGMLFDFERDQGDRDVDGEYYIPLDMIFVNGDGRIRRIAENTTPLSKATIPSGGPVRGVLEVIGGTARKFEIKPGDRVAHPSFRATDEGSER